MKKHTNKSAILLTVIILICFYLTFAFASESREKQDSWFGRNKDIFTTIGAALGTLAFIWKILDARKKFLHIDLEVCINGGFVLAKTMVENKSPLRKKIKKAIILIGPEAENPIDTAKKLFTDQPIVFTNDIGNIDFDQPKYEENGRAIIPIDFYYSENLSIADERIGYDVPLKTENFAKDTPYAVRFFIFAKYRLHRSTEKTFILSESA